jgi:hypothetical protein
MKPATPVTRTFMCLRAFGFEGASGGQGPLPLHPGTV